MKRFLIILMALLILISSIGCSSQETVDLVATTLPVYDFTAQLCQGTDLYIGRLITENVSCLHDYTLQVSQMKMIEEADSIIISGAGLEDSFGSILSGCNIIDSSTGIVSGCASHTTNHGEHHHETDPHIWLDPTNAKRMAQNICDELCLLYPEYQTTFQQNLTLLIAKFDALQKYGNAQLSALSVRELITFHDGFGYFAESFNLTILEAIEEESGSEASAAEIIHLIDLVETHSLPAIFIETNGSDACAGIIHNETGADIYALDMAMSGTSYFDAMYHNIDTIKEALG